jgi:Ca2+-binding EF-hand superfamily protein
VAEGKSGSGGLAEGTKVEARYRGRDKWFAGVVKRAKGGRYDILYDDGDTEEGVAAEMVRVLEPQGTVSDEKSAPKEKAASGDALSVGSKVEARYRGLSRWYPGSISKVRPDGSFDIAYDDGKEERRVERGMIRLRGADADTRRKGGVEGDELQEGMTVEARYHGGQRWFAGKIIKVRTGGTYDIRYEDGDQEERVAKEMIRVVGDRQSQKQDRSEEGAKRDRPPDFHADMRVEGKYRGTTWKKGKILRVRADGTLDLLYDDGDRDLALGQDQVRPLDPTGSNDDDDRQALREGARVEARFKGGSKWFKAKITRDRKDGTYDIEYEDGDSEKYVKKDLIRPIKEVEKEPSRSRSDSDGEEELREGTEIEAKFKGGSRWFKGKITRVRPGGTYDVRYVDGDEEQRVLKENVRAVGGKKVVKADREPSEGRDRAEADELRVGARVEARYKGGSKWFKGKITRDRKDGTYDVEYDDGDSEKYVKRESLRVVGAVEGERKEAGGGRSEAEEEEELREGTEVEAKFKGGSKWFKGKITRVRPGGSYDIRYEDGDEEQRLPKENVRAVGGKKKDKADRERSEGRDRAEADEFRVGARVEARYKGGSKWFKGKITRDRKDGTYDVEYDDGDSEKYVKRESLRVVGAVEGERKEAGGGRSEAEEEEEELREGTEVEAKFKGGSKWFKGKITRVRPGGTYDIRYEDGDEEQRLPKENVRAVGGKKKDKADREQSEGRDRAEADELRVGVRVEARYKGGSKWFKGKITRDRKDGTYDVEYDDGDSEKYVKKESIRVLEVKKEPSGSRSDADEEEELREGTEIEAKFKGGSRWFKGKITRVRPGGTYDIRYEDGDEEQRLPKENVRAVGGKKKDKADREPSKGRGGAEADELRVGARVEARYKGASKWFKGKITRDRKDGTYDVEYDDGDSEKYVKRESLRVVGAVEGERKEAGGGRSEAEEEQELREGAEVEAKFKGGARWFKGKITRVRPGGSYDIRYEDGDEEQRLPKENVRAVGGKKKDKADRVEADELRVGARVEARYKGGSKWFKGKITRDRKDGTYDIEYDDGDSEKYMKKESIRVLGEGGKEHGGSRLETEEEVELSEGMDVEAKFKGGSRWFKGKITRVRPGGTYDLRYEDGDEELRVPKENIRAVGGKKKESAGGRGADDLRVDARVEARYKGGSKWFKGKITRDRKDGTYDIEYDDGDSEKYVKKDSIRVLEGERKEAEGGRPDVEEAEELREGTEVEAKFKGGSRWFKGKITRVRPGGTFDIRYEDGDEEQRVPKENVRAVGGKKKDKADRERSEGRDRAEADELRVGARVEARYKGGSKWFKGKITRDRKDGTYDVEYDDGDSEKYVKRESLRVVGAVEGERKEAGGGRSEAEDEEELREGTEVEAKFKGGARWFKGKITRVRPGGTYDIRYEDGDEEQRLPKENVRAVGGKKKDKADHADEGNLRVGARVEARYKGGSKWFKGKISRDHKDDTYDVEYDDGDSEKYMKKESIRVLGAERKESGGGGVAAGDEDLREGTEVEAKFKGGSKWFKGKITRVRPGGTYDIRYEDGDEEQRVPKENLRVIGGKDKHASAQADSHHVGARVEARYKGGSKWFKGKITRDRRDGTYDVEYDDGDSEKYVKKESIRVLEGERVDPGGGGGSKADDEELSEGTEVEAKFKGGSRWFKGKVTRVRPGGTYDVRYEDGDEEQRVPKESIRIVGGRKKDKVDRVEAGELRVGARVEARYKGGSKWFKGNITRDRKDGTYDVEYDDGDSDKYVKKDSIRVMEEERKKEAEGKEPKADDEEELSEGMAVEAKFKGGSKWFKGKITRVRPGGSYDIRYQDGDEEQRVPKENVRAIGGKKDKADRVEAVELRVGARVEARYKGGSKWFKGKITRDRKDGTYDVEYDDGDSEKYVKKESIRIMEEERKESGGSPSEKDTEGLREGAAVEAKFKGGSRWFKGNVTRVRPGGTYDIRYADGDEEQRVPKENVRAVEGKRDKPSHAESDEIRVDTRVEARYKRGSKWFKGKITRDRKDGTYDVEYDDGDSEKYVKKESIRVLEKERREPEGGESANEDELEEGMEVEAKFKGGSKWFKGEITRVRPGGTFDIRYEDGDEEQRVPKENVRAIGGKKTDKPARPEDDELRVGAHVEARYKGGSKWFKGKIRRDRKDGTFDIEYDDGDSEKNVKRESIRMPKKGGKQPGGGDSEDEAELREGTRVEAKFKGGSKWFKGEITRVRSGGSYDIRYEDGDEEQRVPKEKIRILGGKKEDKAARPEHDELHVGARVEARYKGGSKWFKGKITRDRKDGTYDVEYDDGDSEKNVKGESIRLLEEATEGAEAARKRASSQDTVLQVGMAVRARFKAGSRWFAGKVTEVHKDGTYTVKYEDGDVEDHVKRELIIGPSVDEPAAKVPEEDVRASRLARLGQGSKQPAPDESELKVGQKVEARWRSASSYSKPRETKQWFVGRVRKHHVDGSYTVEYEDGQVQESVPESLIREAVPHRPRDSGSKESSDQSSGAWRDLVALARATRPDSEVSPEWLREMEDDEARLDLLLGPKHLKRFHAAFDAVDRSHSGYIAVAAIGDAFEELGSKSSREEIADYLRESGNDGSRPLKVDFLGFMRCYASVFYAAPGKTVPSVAEEKGSKPEVHVKAVDHRSAQGSELVDWAKKIGPQRMKRLEELFRQYAVKAAPADSEAKEQKIQLVKVKDLKSLFRDLGCEISRSRLDDWVEDADLKPNEAITLADAAFAYYDLFGESSRSKTRDGDTAAVTQSIRSISELATAIYQEEKWTGSVEQHASLIRRLAIGRISPQIELLKRTRDLFEKMDKDGDGELAVADAAKLLTGIGRSITSLQTQIEEFRKQQATFCLPEFLAAFGFVYEALTDEFPTVASAFAKLRLLCDARAVRCVAETMLRYMDNIIKAPKEAKFWQISVANEIYAARIAQHRGGEALALACGFRPEQAQRGDPQKVMALKASRTSEGKPVESLSEASINDLRLRREEVEQELAALEGAPSVAAALRELRVYHTHADVRAAAEIVLLYVINLLRYPRDVRVYRIKLTNPRYHNAVGRLKNSGQLMEAVGFQRSEEHAAWRFRLRGDSGRQPSHDLALFRFPGLDKTTEEFLWRRKADLEAALQMLDKHPAAGEPDGGKSAGGAKDDLQDAARLHGKTPGELKARRGSKSPPKKPTTQKRGKGGKKTVAPLAEQEEDFSGLKAFFHGKTAAQRAQLAMIRRSFDSLDLNHDQRITADELRTIFRRMGVDSSDRRVEKWIRDRDIDQDDAVSFEEFVLSFGALLQPDTPGWAKVEDTQAIISPNDSCGSSPLTLAFGALRLYSSVPECIMAVEYVRDVIQHILDSPTASSYWRVHLAEGHFDRCVGRLFGGVALMEAIGFQLEENGKVLALRDPKGLTWTSVPQYLLKSLQRTKEELEGHMRGLLHPEISDIAAVSGAIANLSKKSVEERTRWVALLETTLEIIAKIVGHPRDLRVRSISSSSSKFQKVIASLAGGVELLVALGFRESETGGLEFPQDRDLTHLTARHVELETGLAWLKKTLPGPEEAGPKPTSPSKGGPVAQEKPDKGQAASSRSPPKGQKGAPKVGVGKSKSTGALPSSSSQKENAKGAENVESQGDKASMLARQELLKEIRSRKLAEEALGRKENFIKELEQEIKALNTRLSRTMPLRDVKTLARMTTEDHKRAQDLAAKVGLEAGVVPPGALSAADGPRMQSKSGAGKEMTRPKSMTAVGTKVATGNSKITANLKVATHLSADVKMGSIEIHVDQVTGIKVGDKVRIGSQLNSEDRFIVGFASLILDEPLSYNHKEGEEIFILKVTPKERKEFEQKEDRKFLLLGVVIPLIYSVVDEGEKLQRARLLQRAYERRNVIKPMFVLRGVFSASQGVARNLADVKGSFALLASAGRMISMHRGSSNSRSPALSIQLFDEGFSLAEIRRFFNEVDVSGDGKISKIELKNAICRAPHIAAALLANDPNYSRSGQDRTASLFGLLDVDGSADVSWDEFLVLFRPCHELKPYNPFETIQAISIDDSRWRHQTWARGVGDDDVEILKDIFNIYDIDYDRNLNLEEAFMACVELDADEALAHGEFSKLFCRVDEQEDSSIDFSEFLYLRYLISEACRQNHPDGASVTTAIAGWRYSALMGLKKVFDAAAGPLPGDEGGGDVEEPSAGYGGVDDVRSVSKKHFLNSVRLDLKTQPYLKRQLTNRSPSCTLLDALTAAGDREDPSGSVTWKEVEGAIFPEKSPYIMYPRNPLSIQVGRDTARRAEEVATRISDPEQGIFRSFRVHELVSDDSTGRLCILFTDGILETWDSFRHRMVHSEQIITHDGTPTSPVESYEQHLGWRWKVGLDLEHGEYVSAATQKRKQEAEATARAYSCELLHLRPRGTILGYDRLSGVLIVNTTAGDRCIRFHEGATLRRLYRVRLDSALPRMPIFDKALFDLGPERAGLKHFHRAGSQSLATAALGAVKDFTYLPDLEVLICSVLGDSAVRILCTSTGAWLATCKGHDCPLASLYYIAPKRYVVTGGEDGTLRLWDVGRVLLPMIGSRWLKSRQLLQDADSMGDGIGGMALPLSAYENIRAKLLRGLRAVGVKQAWQMGHVTGVLGPRSVEVTYNDMSVDLVVAPDLLVNPKEVPSIANGPTGNHTFTPTAEGPVAVWRFVDQDHVLESVFERLDENGSDDLSLGTFLSGLTDLVGLSSSVRLEGDEDEGDNATDTVTDEELLELAKGFDLTGQHQVSYPLFVRFMLGSGLATIIPERCWIEPIVEPVVLSCRQRLCGHKSSISAISYLSEADLLVSASYDGSLKFWDPQSHKQRLTLYPEAAEFTDFCPFKCVKDVDPAAFIREQLEPAQVDKAVVVQMAPLKLRMSETAGCDVVCSEDGEAEAKALDELYGKERSEHTVSCRGFLYLLETGEMLAVPVPRFDKNFVELDNDSFVHTGGDTKSVWGRRSRVLRILYAISASYSSVMSLREVLANVDHVAARRREALGKFDAEFVVFYRRGDGPLRDLADFCKTMQASRSENDPKDVSLVPAVFLHGNKDGSVCVALDHDEKIHSVPIDRLRLDSVTGGSVEKIDRDCLATGTRCFVRFSRPSDRVGSFDGTGEDDEDCYLAPREVLSGSVVVGGKCYTMSWLISRVNLVVEARHYDHDLPRDIKHSVAKQVLDTWATNLHRFRASCATVMGKTIRALRSEAAVIKREGLSVQKLILERHSSPEKDGSWGDEERRKFESAIRATLKLPRFHRTSTPVSFFLDLLCNSALVISHEAGDRDEKGPTYLVDVQLLLRELQAVSKQMSVMRYFLPEELLRSLCIDLKSRALASHIPRSKVRQLTSLYSSSQVEKKVFVPVIYQLLRLLGQLYPKEVTLDEFGRVAKRVQRDKQAPTGSQYVGLEDVVKIILQLDPIRNIQSAMDLLRDFFVKDLRLGPAPSMMRRYARICMAESLMKEHTAADALLDKLSHQIRWTGHRAVFSNPRMLTFSPIPAPAAGGALVAPSFTEKDEASLRCGRYHSLNRVPDRCRPDFTAFEGSAWPSNSPPLVVTEKTRGETVCMLKAAESLVKSPGGDLRIRRLRAIERLLTRRGLRRCPEAMKVHDDMTVYVDDHKDFAGFAYRSLDSPFLVVERLSGWTPLREVIAGFDGMVWSSKKLALLRQWLIMLLNGLATYHDNGIILRDLSSRTVLISPDGSALRLTSFVNVAPMAPDEEETVTMEAFSLGEPESLPPEAVRYDPVLRSLAVKTGEALKSSTKATWDVWSFGSIMFEACFGATLPSFGSQLRRFMECQLQELPQRDLLNEKAMSDLRQAFHYDILQEIQRICARSTVNFAEGDDLRQQLLDTITPTTDDGTVSGAAILAKALSETGNLLWKPDSGPRQDQDSRGAFKFFRLKAEHFWTSSDVGRAVSVGERVDFLSQLDAKLSVAVRQFLATAPDENLQTLAYRAFQKYDPRGRGTVPDNVLKDVLQYELKVSLTEAEAHFLAFCAETDEEGMLKYTSLMERILDRAGTETKTVLHHILQLLLRCLHPDPAQRPTVHQLQTSPFFLQTDEERKRAEAQAVLTFRTDKTLDVQVRKAVVDPAKKLIKLWRARKDTDSVSSFPVGALADCIQDFGMYVRRVCMSYNHAATQGTVTLSYALYQAADLLLSPPLLQDLANLVLDVCGAEYAEQLAQVRLGSTTSLAVGPRLLMRMARFMEELFVEVRSEDSPIVEYIDLLHEVLVVLYTGTPMKLKHLYGPAVAAGSGSSPAALRAFEAVVLEVLADAGMGSAMYLPVQRYISSCHRALYTTMVASVNDFSLQVENVERALDWGYHLLRRRFIRTSSYFGELLGVGRCLCSLSETMDTPNKLVKQRRASLTHIRTLTKRARLLYQGGSTDDQLSSMQQAQLFVDFNLAEKLLAFCYADTDSVVRGLLGDICQDATLVGLEFLQQLDAESARAHPMVALALQFCSVHWVRYLMTSEPGSSVNMKTLEAIIRAGPIAVREWQGAEILSLIAANMTTEIAAPKGGGYKKDRQSIVTTRTLLEAVVSGSSTGLERVLRSNPLLAKHVAELKIHYAPHPQGFQALLARTHDIAIGGTLMEVLAFLTNELYVFLRSSLGGGKSGFAKAEDGDSAFTGPMTTIFGHVWAWFDRCWAIIKASEPGKKEEEIRCETARGILNQVFAITRYLINLRNDGTLVSGLLAAPVVRHRDDDEASKKEERTGIHVLVEKLSSEGTDFDPYARQPLLPSVTRLVLVLADGIACADTAVLCQLADLGAGLRFADALEMGMAVVRESVRTGTETIHMIHTYPAARAARRRFWSSLLQSGHARLQEQVILSGVIETLLVGMLPDMSYVKIINKTLPPEFEIFNRTFAVRMEAMEMLDLVVANKSHAEAVFMELIRQSKRCGVVYQEKDRLRKNESQQQYRRTVTKVLHLISRLAHDGLDRELHHIGLPYETIRLARAQPNGYFLIDRELQRGMSFVKTTGTEDSDAPEKVQIPEETLLCGNVDNDEMASLLRDADMGDGLNRHLSASLPATAPTSNKIRQRNMKCLSVTLGIKGDLGTFSLADCIASLSRESGIQEEELEVVGIKDQPLTIEVSVSEPLAMDLWSKCRRGSIHCRGQLIWLKVPGKAEVKASKDLKKAEDIKAAQTTAPESAPAEQVSREPVQRVGFRWAPPQGKDPVRKQARPSAPVSPVGTKAVERPAWPALGSLGDDSKASSPPCDGTLVRAAMDRLGDQLYEIKCAFSHREDSEHLLSSTSLFKVLLDLRLSEDDASFALERYLNVFRFPVDFARFLQVYADASGLIGKPEQGTDGCWVENRSGHWDRLLPPKVNSLGAIFEKYRSSEEVGSPRASLKPDDLYDALQEAGLGVTKEQITHYLRDRFGCAYGSLMRSEDGVFGSGLTLYEFLRAYHQLALGEPRRPSPGYRTREFAEHRREEKTAEASTIQPRARRDITPKEVGQDEKPSERTVAPPGPVSRTPPPKYSTISTLQAMIASLESDSFGKRYDETAAESEPTPLEAVESASPLPVVVRQMEPYGDDDMSPHVRGLDTGGGLSDSGGGDESVDAFPSLQARLRTLNLKYESFDIPALGAWDETGDEESHHRPTLVGDGGHAKPHGDRTPDESAVRRVFDMYDLNGDGVISFLELKTVFSKQGRHVSASEIR